MSENVAVPLPRPAAASPSWLRIAVMTFIFLCGVAAGAGLGGIWMRSRMLHLLQHPPGLTDRILPRLRSELELTDEQARRVETIVHDRHERMESLRAEAYPRQMAEFTAMRREIESVLSAEQASRWTALCDSIERRYLPVQPKGPPPAELIFSRFDTDGDGELAEEEIPSGMWRRLRLADRNGDGRVTRDEFSVAREAISPSPE